MKKFTFIFTLLAALLVSFTAAAAPVINLYGEPDSYYVNQMYPTATLTPDAEGYVKLQGNFMSYGFVYAAEGWTLISVTDRSTGAELSLSADTNGVARCMLSKNAGGPYDYDIKCVKDENVQKITFTAYGTGDEISNISMISTVTHTGISLSDTPQEFTVNEGDKFQIRGAAAGKNIFGVWVNGDPLAGDGYGTWYYTPAEGDVLVVQSTAPNQEVPVGVMLGEGVGTNVISEFLVGSTVIPASTWYPEDEDDRMGVKMGSMVSIQLNKRDYKNFSVTINGEDVALSVDADFNFMVFSETGYLVTIDAEAVEVSVNSVDAEMEDCRIFNLQGIEVKSENLPAGLYIRNGKLIKF